MNAHFERFLRESASASSIASTGVVEVLEVGRDAQYGPFIVMELLEGESLVDRLQRGPMDPEEAFDVAIQLVETLAAVHQHGIVHRDLKPPNIFLHRDGDEVVVKVLDFGIARVKGETFRKRLTITGEIVGTPRFMAPEQAFGGEVDHRADLYAAGLILWCCLTGEPPYAGVPRHDLIRHLGRDPTPLEQFRPGLAAPIYEVVGRALAQQPSARFQSASEMASALRAIFTNRTSLSPPPPTRQHALPSDPIPTATYVLTIVRLGHRFLLVRERDGTWYLPAGGVRPGETLVQAALREAREEAGVPIALEGVARVQHTVLSRGSRLRCVFVGRPIDDTPPKTKPDEHSLHAGWFSIDELAHVPLRGEEVRDMLGYIASGGPVFPLSLVSNERAPWRP